MMLTEADFAGDWLFNRRIEDRFGGQEGIVTGTANFVRQDDKLLYRETGRMQIGAGPVLTAERSYLWRFGDVVEVLFDDGRAFHSFVPQGQGQGTDHPCGPDYYKVAYDFTAWPNWSSTYVVSGPRKDYTSQTTYNRP